MPTNENAPTYRQYRRTQIAEMADWGPGFDMTRVSVSDADKDAGSPKLGDKIARNPANHDDRWLVAADYFAVNFEPLAAPVESGSVGEAAPKVCPIHAVEREEDLDGSFCPYCEAERAIKELTGRPRPAGAGADTPNEGEG